MGKLRCHKGQMGQMGQILQNFSLYHDMNSQVQKNSKVIFFM
jgi:hypothetical protein